MGNHFEPEIVVLYCGRSLAEGTRLSESKKKGSGYKVRFIMLPCSSKVEVDHLVRLIEEGVDGIQLITCPEKMCRFLTGNDAAKRRFNYAAKLMKEVGLDAGRLGMIQKQMLSHDEIIALVEGLANAVRSLGENPMKSNGG